jgi:hypothetical protein
LARNINKARQISLGEKDEEEFWPGTSVGQENISREWDEEVFWPGTSVSQDKYL